MALAYIWQSDHGSGPSNSVLNLWSGKTPATVGQCGFQLDKSASPASHLPLCNAYRTMYNVQPGWICDHGSAWARLLFLRRGVINQSSGSVVLSALQWAGFQLGIWNISSADVQFNFKCGRGNDKWEWQWNCNENDNNNGSMYCNLSESSSTTDDSLRQLSKTRSVGPRGSTFSLRPYRPPLGPSDLLWANTQSECF